MYQALYRKYRPSNFDDVVGQDIIKKTLINSIKNNSLSHAYMFFGPRGVGKTTVSKIFARSINCLNPIEGNACGKCKNCLYSFEKECVDIIEIDAASNNGVDEIRELRNNVSLVPAELKYKVYIIDEVHMLSIGAFNAFLKTLEEPPKHVIFILATTDPQKVPDTIISRCQCFSFKRITEENIVSRLKEVCKLENIEIEEDVLKQIAIISDGGLRDSLGMLDKLSSYCNKKITINDFADLNGMVTNLDLNDLYNIIFSGNISEYLSKISLFYGNGKNLIQIMIQFMHYLRDILIKYYINNENPTYNINLIQNLINVLNEKMFEIKKSSNPRIYIEMLILKFINDNIISQEINDNKSIELGNKYIVGNKKTLGNNCVNDSKLGNNNEIIQNDINQKTTNDKNIINDNSNVCNCIENDDNTEFVDVENCNVIENINEIIDIRVNNTLALANKQLLKLELENFNLLNDFTFDQEIGYIVCSILDGKIRAVSNNNLILSFEYDSIVKQNLLNLDKITEVYNKITNSNKKIAIISDEKWENVKKQYILSLKNNEHYIEKEEPKEIYKNVNNSDIINYRAIELFGSDIVDVK